MAKRINYAALYTLRKDGRYMGTYSDETGRHYVYDRDPETLYRKIQDLTVPKEETTPTFGQVADEWEREHREEIEPRTWNNYAPHVSDMIETRGNTPIDQMEASDVLNDLSRAKAKGYSATVVNTRKSIFKMIFDFAIIKGYIKYNPATAVRLPKGLKRGKRKAPTKEQMQVILTNVSAPFGLFPFLLLCTGMRKSEALALTWGDIDLEQKTIRVDKSIDYTDQSAPKYKSPKTEAGVRTVPIIDILLEQLQKEYKVKKSSLLFPCPSSNRGGPGGGLMKERAYDGAWERYCKAVGLMEEGKPSITAHNLRHGTATLMFELGVDELTAQHILGHSRVEITREIYTDLRDQQRKKSVNKLNKGLSKMLSIKKKAL